jgi:pilus assembly protein CpaE
VSFSTKGGVGKSVVSTNLAVALALEHRNRVVLVDADLQFGDVGVLLGVPPVHTTLEAAGAIDSADTELMEGILETHEASSLRVLCAPIEPSAADSISPEAMVAIVRLLRRMFDYVVVDMPPHFDDVVLALLEEADDVLLVASMDIPSIKNLKVGIQTLDLLALAGSKLRLVLNRANARVNLDIADVERALGVSAEFRVPSDISVPQAVNRGVPVVVDRPRSAAAIALRSLAQSVAGGPVGAHAEPDPEPAPKRRGWHRDR